MPTDFSGLINRCLLSCLVLFASVVSSGQTLTLYTFPPPHPYRWHSPHSLLVSTVRNYYSKPANVPRRILGHMVIELKKDSAVLLTGMVSDEISGMKDLLLKEKIGLGVLFKLVKGHLEETSHVQAELKMRTESSKAAFVSFKISDSAYHYLLAFIDSFKRRGYDSLYNGLNMPRAGKGSGCTAFGISLLELINALLPEYSEKWAVHLNIPEKLIGSAEKQKKVSIMRILFSFRWATNTGSCRKLLLYEPYLIYNWVNHLWKTAYDQPDTGYQFVQTGHARGVVIDCSQYLPVLPMFTQ
jgi:hypothetical protein